MDMTPMVDIVFQLLIFFMVTASFSLQRSRAVFLCTSTRKGRATIEPFSSSKSIPSRIRTGPVAHPVVAVRGAENAAGVSQPAATSHGSRSSPPNASTKKSTNARVRAGTCLRLGMPA